MPGLVRTSVVVDEQQVHHEPDDLARGEVLTGGLVRQLRELADQFLVEVAHLDVRHDVGVQVDVGELADDLVQQVGPSQPVDLDAEVELVDDVPGGLGEAPDVQLERVGDRVRVVQQLGEGQRRGVVELLPRHRLQDRLHVLDPARQLPVPVEDGLLGCFQDAVQAADHRQRQDDLAVLGLLVVATEKVCHAPDEGGMVPDRFAPGAGKGGSRGLHGVLLA